MYVCVLLCVPYNCYQQTAAARHFSVRKSNCSAANFAIVCNCAQHCEQKSSCTRCVSQAPMLHVHGGVACACGAVACILWNDPRCRCAAREKRNDDKRREREDSQKWFDRSRRVNRHRGGTRNELLVKNARKRTSLAHSAMSVELCERARATASVNHNTINYAGCCLPACPPKSLCKNCLPRVSCRVVAMALEIPHAHAH